MGTKSYTGRVEFSTYRRILARASNGVYSPETNTSSLKSLATMGTRTGVSNPEWKAQIARGECATTPFTASKTTARYSNVLYHLKTRANAANDLSSTEYSGVFGPGFLDPNLTFIPVTNARNAASINFFKHARKAQRNIQSGVLIGELAETIHMIRDPAIAMRSLVDKFVSNAHKRSKRSLGIASRIRSTSKSAASRRSKTNIANAIGDSWLEMAFGWAPLAGDLKSGAEALARIHLRMEREFQEVSGKGYEYTTTNILDHFNQVPGVPLWFREIWKQEIRTESKFYGRVRVGVPGSPDCQVMASLGLTLGDVIPTAWELVPWSFLIDYFSNVGDVIDACCFPRADIAWTTLTEHQYVKMSNIWTYDRAETYRVASNTTRHLEYCFAGNALSYSEKSAISRGEIVIPLPFLQFHLPYNTDQYKNIAGLILGRSRPPKA